MMIPAYWKPMIEGDKTAWVLLSEFHRLKQNATSLLECPRTVICCLPKFDLAGSPQ